MPEPINAMWQAARMTDSRAEIAAPAILADGRQGAGFPRKTARSLP
jgi:hypothetical protein